MFKWFGRVNYTPHSKLAGFAVHLRHGRLMGSRCRACGRRSFPPRADCPDCLGPDFEFCAISGRGRLYTFTRIAAAPSGFEDQPPYWIGVVDLEEGGRALATIGETVDPGGLRIGMELQLVPRLLEDIEEIRVDYTLEQPGTTRPGPHAVAAGHSGEGEG